MFNENVIEANIIVSALADKVSAFNNIMTARRIIISECSNKYSDCNIIIGERSNIIGERSNIIGERSNIIGERSNIIGECADALA